MLGHADLLIDSLVIKHLGNHKQNSDNETKSLFTSSSEFNIILEL